MEPERRPSDFGRVLIGALGVLALLFIVGAIFGNARRHNTDMQRDLVTRVFTQPVHEQIGTGAMTIEPGHYVYYTLQVPKGARDIKISGRFGYESGDD
jgi:hypothetical protein